MTIRLLQPYQITLINPIFNSSLPKLNRSPPVYDSPFKHKFLVTFLQPPLQQQNPYPHTKSEITFPHPPDATAHRTADPPSINRLNAAWCRRYNDIPLLTTSSPRIALSGLIWTGPPATPCPETPLDALVPLERNTLATGGWSKGFALPSLAGEQSETLTFHGSVQMKVGRGCLKVLPVFLCKQKRRGSFD